MYTNIVDRIEEFDNIVIARHIGVDPDALCSQLALRDSIRLTYPNKKVIAIGTGSSRFTSFGKLDKVEVLNNSLFIVLDTPNKKRVDLLDFSKGDFIIKIDHHPFIEKFADIELIDDTKTSTCEIIMDLILNTKLDCDSSISELLYMGLVSDSNRFLFDNSNYKTFKLVSKYLELYPFNISSVYDKLYTRPLNEVRLEGYIGMNMKVTSNGLGYVYVSNDVITELGVDSASAGNMINNFNYIKEVIIWATITEDLKNKQYRVSIRSRGPEINKICETYNGGGHKFASGVKLKRLDEALKLMDDLDKILISYNKVEED